MSSGREIGALREKGGRSRGNGAPVRVRRAGRKEHRWRQEPGRRERGRRRERERREPGRRDRPARRRNRRRQRHLRMLPTAVGAREIDGRRDRRGRGGAARVRERQDRG